MKERIWTMWISWMGCSETRCSGRYLRHLADTCFPDTDISEVFLKHGGAPRILEYVNTLAILMTTVHFP